MRGNTCKISLQKSVWTFPEKWNISIFLGFFLVFGLFVSALRTVSLRAHNSLFSLCRIIPHIRRLAKTSMPSIIPPPLTGLIWPPTAWMAQAPRQPTSCKIPPLPWPDRLLNFTQVCIKKKHTGQKEINHQHSTRFTNMQTNVRFFTVPWYWLRNLVSSRKIPQFG